MVPSTRAAQRSGSSSSITHDHNLVLSPPSRGAPYPQKRSQSLRGLPSSTGQVPSDAENIQKFDEAFDHLSNLIRVASVYVVRQVLRHQRETPVSRSQSHPAFLVSTEVQTFPNSSLLRTPIKIYLLELELNVIMREADPYMLSQAVRDSGQRMVKSSKQQIVEHLSAEDLDEVAEILLSKVSNGFLDMAVKRRMETISVQDSIRLTGTARPVNEMQDIEEEKHDNEQASRSMAPSPTPSITLQPALSQSDPTPPASPTPAARYLSQAPSDPKMPWHGTESTLIHTSCQDHSIESSSVPPNNHAYSALTATERAEFDMKMKNAEAHYGWFMEEARKLPEPERTRQLSDIGKQYKRWKATLERKYKGTLGEKRTRHQMNAERKRASGLVNGPSLSGREGSASSVHKRVRLL